MKDNNDIDIARVFMDFMLEYYALIRRHIVEVNRYRVHSHGFTLLYTLRGCKGRAVTMTKFASELGVTKQQLTKLVNDLERQGFVVRRHDMGNRRQVYIEITESGIEHIEKMADEIINEIITSLSNFNEDEKKKISTYAQGLTGMFRHDATFYCCADGQKGI